MKTSIRHFLAGIGSLMAICPTSSYANFVPKASASDRINGHWVKTGSQLRGAMNAYEESPEKHAKNKLQPTSKRGC